ncbi:type I-E CRISPR-associated protein Cas7/Cse4/CasC [Corynebacterium lubricantis]|uniref:type I-E CRISPR-associated protein Cas7/Cse4/CasC n=1 Tax=Corynebacterium lubricantis TaxID=541095 RepID=UPI00037FFF8C|nr:type I-E CRISPR-associated protein Cas7/Cse4/CasC [Corynebacterium lubricantis]
MSTVVDIHALQTLPPSLINRDDTGAPKTAIFGGVPRQRVSSQSWKRAIRRYVEENVSEDLIGERTKRTPELIAKKVNQINSDWDLPKAVEGVDALFKAAKIKLSVEAKKQEADPDVATEEKEEFNAYPQTGYLLFLSPQQIQRAAEAIIEKDGEKFSKKEAEEILDTEHSLDIAMFGRMLADAPTYNVDASVQVAHAISVHETQPEFDYFTAVDDVVEDAEESGAGMIGTVQMMSSTLYRFATINVDGLKDNLGSAQNAHEAVGHFIRAFVESMPTGKQNTFANNTLPELVYVAVRDGRSVSLVNAFEEPVSGTSDQGRRRVAAQKLAEEERQVIDTYGFKPRKAFVLSLGDLGQEFEGIAESTKLDDLAAQVQAVLEEN